MLREELDDILMFINEATLSDTEWQQIKSMFAGSEVECRADIDSLNVDLKNKYKALYGCVRERCGEGNSVQRLGGYFIAKGIIDPMVIDINVLDPRDFVPRDYVSRGLDLNGKDHRIFDPRASDQRAGKSDLCNVMVGGVLE